MAEEIENKLLQNDLPYSVHTAAQLSVASAREIIPSISSGSAGAYLNASVCRSDANNIFLGYSSVLNETFDVNISCTNTVILIPTTTLPKCYTLSEDKLFHFAMMLT